MWTNTYPIYLSYKCADFYMIEKAAVIFIMKLSTALSRNMTTICNITVNFQNIMENKEKIRKEWWKRLTCFSHWELCPTPQHQKPKGYNQRYQAQGPSLF